ncbi:macrophage mannose receptor 1 [Plakobranchus ocellatus]|uniref:Macrophage mannose receptor 1 n=1 Tax=Plakobranchus ocellatus TaxID=259542 RepID=A0AAV3YBC6_9GAST|nr:macrophage mannose receptor 1 [Plakobranchus ocellatus]
MVHFIAYVMATAFVTVTASQLECPDGFSLYKNYCYYLGDAGYDFNEAEDECDEKHSELVTISSSKEKTFIKKLLKDDDATGAWIRADESGRDALTKAKFVKKVVDKTSDRKCDALSSALAWKREEKDCDIKDGMKFVCKTRTLAQTCTSRTCFALFPERDYHSGAQTQCESLGGSLASIRSEEESKAVKAYLDKVSGNTQLFALHDVWTAGSDEDTETEWYWHTDGEKVKIPDDLTDWKTDEPNNVDTRGRSENCMVMVSPDWKWNDVNCREWKVSLCEIPNVNPITG